MLCLAGGTAHDQRHRYFRDVRRHIDSDAVFTRTVDCAQQRADGQIGYAAHIHAHGRQGRGDHGGKDEIVETGDARLFRHLDALALQFGECAQRMQIGYGGKGGETFGNPVSKTKPATRAVRLFNGVNPERLRHACLAKTIANTAKTVVLHIGIPVFAHQHHLAMAKPRQIFANLPAAIPMVGGNRISGCRGTVDNRNRAIDIGNARTAAGDNHHAIHTALDQPVDGIRLHGDLAARIGNQHTVTGRDRRLFDGLRDLREKRIGDVRQNQPQNA
ncbi:hypothetical protein D3C80_839350 [compost metagenome]